MPTWKVRNTATSTDLQTGIAALPDAMSAGSTAMTSIYRDARDAYILANPISSVGLTKRELDAARAAREKAAQEAARVAAQPIVVLAEP